MKKLKKQKGFTTIDIVIAVVMLTIFVPIITTLIYNIGISSKSAERKAKAVNYATQYLEYAKMSDVRTVTPDEIENLITLEPGYTANITLTSITSTSKKVTVDIEYSVGKETKKISLYTNI